MPSKTENVKLGVCTVTFDGVDLGYTKGGVEVEVNSSTKKVMVDQFGESEINEYITGRTTKIKMSLAETTLENLVRIMPGATMKSSGGAKATGTLTFSTAPPISDDKVTINGVDFTFKTSPSGPNQMGIPGTIAAAALALKNAINASTNPAVSQLTATSSGAVVTLTADDEGTEANDIVIAKTFATGANFTIVGMSGGTAPTKKAVVVTNGVGVSLLSLAKKLVLHPLALPAEDVSEDVTVFKAMTPGNMQWSFKLDDERVFPVEFTGYPDATTKKVFIVGDESADV